jgi:pimeloyl-ACP methyl ester carboxylesterase
MPERMIQANGVELCTEPFGDPADPPILLMHGNGASMLWWEEGFCRVLADGGRFVIRYDHRDTGRSVSYEPGHPGYTGADMVADAAGVLGASSGGAMAQVLALDFPGRVRSLVLISTSRAVSGGGPLPPPTEEFMDFVSRVRVDWSDRESVIEYLVDYWHVLSGSRAFDEAGTRDLVRRDVERARDFAAAQNHDLVGGGGGHRGGLSSITTPTLVIHGTDDPMFPLGHGEALADEIPNASLLTLEGAGHGVERADWQVITAAILEHT